MTTPHSTRPGQPGAEADQGSGSSVPQQTAASWQGEPAGGYAVSGPPGSGRPGADLARSAWPAFLAAGLACFVVGMMLVFWPKATLTIVAVLIGVSLIVAGLLRLIDGFTAHDASGGKRAANIVIGLLAGIVGLYCLKHHDLTIAVLAFVVGVFWVMHGVADIAIGVFGGPFPGRVLTAIAGVFSLFAGLIVLFWPAISVNILLVVIGIWLIVYGILMTTMAVSLRRHGASAPGPGQLAAA